MRPGNCVSTLSDPSDRPAPPPHGCRRTAAVASSAPPKQNRRNQAVCDDDIHQGLTYDPTISRRAFGLAAVAVTGLTAAQAHAQAQVVETDVTIKTAGRHGRRRSLPPARQGPLARRADLDRYPGPAPRLPRHGPSPGLAGLCGARAKPLLPLAEGPGGGRGLRLQQAGRPGQDHAPRRQAERRHRQERRRGLHRLPRRPAADQQEGQGGRAGLLHGRAPLTYRTRRRRARPRGRRRHLPRRRASSTAKPGQPAPPDRGP